MALIVLPFTCKAQGVKDSLRVKVFEFEVRNNYTYSLDNGSWSTFIGFGLEARWNLRNIPLDLGITINTSGRRHGGLDYQTAALLAVSDWNFRRGQKVSPFVGLGVGTAYMQRGYLFYKEEQTAFALMPRVGLELFRHLRVGVTLNVTKTPYSNMAVSVGYAFGGGLKKKK